MSIPSTGSLYRHLRVNGLVKQKHEFLRKIFKPYSDLHTTNFTFQGTRSRERERRLTTGEMSFSRESPENSSLGSGSMGDDNDRLFRSMCIYLTLCDCEFEWLKYG